MPRIGQLLSALLIALIGVLVVQMFLFAALQQERTRDQALPPVANDTTAAPAPAFDPLLAGAPPPAAPQIPHVGAEQRPIVIIITHVSPTAVPAPARMIDFPEETEDQPSAQSDGGKALIERLIELSGKPIRRR